MDSTLEPLSSAHREAVMDIFNYYVEHSFAAYPAEKMPHIFFNGFLQQTKEFPAVVVKGEDGTVLGFGALRPHSPIPTFAGVAEITYFVHPEHTGKGLGAKILEYLVAGAKEKGITCILASISGLNEGSIRFHAKHGFVECGRFRRVGKKLGQEFDVVWMQRFLDADRRN